MIKIIIIPCLASLFLLSSCSKDNLQPEVMTKCESTTSSNTNMKAPDANNPFTGRDYFRGVIFAQGKVATKVPELRDYMPQNFIQGANLNYVTLLNESKIDFFESKYPGYFDLFKTDLISKNPEQIKKRLLDTYTKIDALKSDFMRFDNSDLLAKQIVDNILNSNGNADFNTVAQQITQNLEQAAAAQQRPPCLVAAAYRYVAIADWFVLFKDKAYFFAADVLANGGNDVQFNQFVKSLSEHL